ncbi:hypothetical protein BJX70DRAFT_380697 [Aspergillus crustosus]
MEQEWNKWKGRQMANHEERSRDRRGSREMRLQWSHLTMDRASQPRWEDHAIGGSLGVSWLSGVGVAKAFAFISAQSTYMLYTVRVESTKQR